MMHRPVVSVVIPTYNHASYILATLDSVFAQTFTDYEVIVVNDGSPDNTAELLLPLREAGRIRYFEQSNAGQASARNYGLTQARGEFIAFLDDDDLWPPDKLEWQVNALRGCGAVLIGGAVALFKDNAAPYLHLASRLDSMRINELAGGCPFSSPGQTLMRRSALQQIGGFDTTIWGADDFDLYLRLASHGELRSERRVSLQYRIHPGNASINRIRMLSPIPRVVRRHFPAIGGPLSRSAYRSLYASAGREWVLAARRAVRHLQFFRAVANLRTVGCFVPAALRDSVLARQMVLDLIPERFSSQDRILAYHLMVEIAAPASSQTLLPESVA